MTPGAERPDNSATSAAPVERVLADGTELADDGHDGNGLRRRLARVLDWLHDQREAVFLAVDNNTTFPESSDELRAKLATDDADVAAEILSEAEDAHNRLRDRVDGAERRATTLQGASAIAASLALTAAGLIIDPAKLRGWGWQLLFGLTVIYITFALVMCAWRATLASSRVHSWVAPPDRDILERGAQDIARARVERSVALLRVVGGNQRFARYKVAMLRAATEWIVRALVALLVLAILATTYALFGPDLQPQSQSSPPARTSP